MLASIARAFAAETTSPLALVEGHGHERATASSGLAGKTEDLGKIDERVAAEVEEIASTSKFDGLTRRSSSDSFSWPAELSASARVPRHRIRRPTSTGDNATIASARASASSRRPWGCTVQVSSASACAWTIHLPMPRAGRELLGAAVRQARNRSRASRTVRQGCRTARPSDGDQLLRALAVLPPSVPCLAQVTLHPSRSARTLAAGLRANDRAQHRGRPPQFAAVRRRLASYPSRSTS